MRKAPHDRSSGVIPLVPQLPTASSLAPQRVESDFPSSFGLKTWMALPDAIEANPKKVGASGLAGAAAGAALGAAYGSVVPILGTSIGAVAGAVLGGLGLLGGAEARAKQGREDAIRGYTNTDLAQISFAKNLLSGYLARIPGGGIDTSQAESTVATLTQALAPTASQSVIASAAALAKNVPAQIKSLEQALDQYESTQDGVSGYSPRGGRMIGSCCSSCAHGAPCCGGGVQGVGHGGGRGGGGRRGGGGGYGGPDYEFSLPYTCCPTGVACAPGTPPCQPVTVVVNSVAGIRSVRVGYLRVQGVGNGYGSQRPSSMPGRHYIPASALLR
jgi:hypothetical protein